MPICDPRPNDNSMVKNKIDHSLKTKVKKLFKLFKC